jgi:hypothetical protein
LTIDNMKQERDIPRVAPLPLVRRLVTNNVLPFRGHVHHHLAVAASPVLPKPLDHRLDRKSSLTKELAGWHRISIRYGFTTRASALPSWSASRESSGTNSQSGCAAREFRYLQTSPLDASILSPSHSITQDPSTGARSRGLRIVGTGPRCGKEDNNECMQMTYHLELLCRVSYQP